jgi:hypothetical protein
MSPKVYKCDTGHSGRWRCCWGGRVERPKGLGGNMTDLHFEGTRAPLGSTSSISSAELADRNTAELIELRQAVAAGARTGDDDFVEWCTQTDKLIVAEIYRRAYVQAAIDAQAAVIIDEERRLACGAR